MKIAFIADIHSNSWALKAVIKDIRSRRINEIYDLGDSLCGPMDPLGTFRLLQRHKIPSICGNADRFILEARDSNLTLNFARNKLSDSGALVWLETLPKTQKINFDILLCHGTPFSDDEYLLEIVDLSGKVMIKRSETLDHDLENIPESIILCAHSHRPGILSTEIKTIINPGSVGVPAYYENIPFPHVIETHNNRAHYSILTISNTFKIEMVSIQYDFEAAATSTEQHGRSDWAEWIRTGRASL